MRALTALRLVVVGVIVVAACVPIDNPDTFGHLAAGRQIAELGRVPSHDTFSFFRDQPQPWVDYEWLSAVLFWQAYAHGGANGLLALELALLAVCGLMLVQVAFERGGARAAALCALLATFGAPTYRMRFSARPQVFGFALTALYLWGLDRIAEASDDHVGRRRAQRWIVGLACAQVLWVNLHGSNLLGLMITAAHLVAYARHALARRRLALVFGLQLAACCLSPYGPAILLDALDHVLDPAYRELVGEWSPWEAHHPLVAMVGVLAQGACLLLALRGFRTQGARGTAALLVCLGFAAMSARAVRFVAELVLLASPLIAAGLAPWLEAWSPRLRGAVLSALAAFVALYAPLAAAHAPPHVRPGIGTDTRALPVLSARWLAAHHPRARVFAAMEDGWYLMFAVPTAQQLLDGRVPFYGVEHVQLTQRAFASGQVFADVVARFGVDTVVVQHTLEGQQPLLAALRASGDFVAVEVEDRHALFVRRAVAEGVGAARPEAFSLGFDVLGGLAAAPAAVARELKRLPQHPNACALRGLWSAVARLDGLQRPGTTPDRGAGFRAPTSAAERERFKSAQAELSRAIKCMPHLPVLRAYAAAAAIGACDLNAAEMLLAELTAQGGSRESLLLGQELVLRRGQVDEVRQFLQAANAMPDARGDAWLAALEAELATPPRCP